jgi:uncharacterized membrane protein YfcA
MAEFTFASIALLFFSGLLAGGINAVAGGGTLITFPALLAAGLPPVVATASNALAVWPGHALAAMTARGRWSHPLLAGRRAHALWALGLLGGATGAALLRMTGDAVMAMLVPLLVGLATLAFACGPLLARWVARREGRASARWPLAVVFVVCTYGGFFGAGLGVMLMAVLLALGVRDMHENNRAKNLIATAVTTTSLLLVAASGLVAWAPATVVLAGAVAGGALGGRWAERIHPARLRLAVIAAGAVLTVHYGLRYWAA